MIKTMPAKAIFLPVQTIQQDFQPDPLPLTKNPSAALKTPLEAIYR